MSSVNGSSVASLPEIPSETSRGSSVSSDLQKEYEDLLKYALVTPRFEAAPTAYSSNLFGTEGPSLLQLVDLPRMTTKEKQANLSTIVEGSSTGTNLSKNEEVRDHGGVLKMANRVMSSQLPAVNMNPLKQIGDDADPEIPVTIMDQVNESLFSSDLSSSASGRNEAFGEALDEDLVKIENLMDEWCLELKRNVLGEFSCSKLKILERMQQTLNIEKKKHFAEEDALQNQIESHKELLHTFEKSIHQKDIVITNLTDALHKQKEKHEKLKLLLNWKLKHNDEKREEFATKMAHKHYQRSIMTKAWLGWRNVIEIRWKKRVEHACQARSQEVCIKLTEDYEERLRGLQKSLEMARLEVARLHNERDNYEETMKKAFMRGVCALNMEAMSMFKEPALDENNENKDPRINEFLQKDNATLNPIHGSESQLKDMAVENQSYVRTSKQRSESRMHVRAIAKEGFKSKAAASSKLATCFGQPTATSVYIENHKSDDIFPSMQPSINKRDNTSTALEVKRSSGRNQARNQEVKVVE